MKRILLTLFSIFAAVEAFAQCTITPCAATFIMSPLTVGANYTLNGTGTYPASKAFYICQGTTLTIQNRSGADTFYVATGGALVGFEANNFKVFVKNGASYNASNSMTALIYYETGSTITNYTGPMLPPCPALTFTMTSIGPNACTTTTGIAENANMNGNIFLYPNPAQNEISVNIYLISAKLSACVYDMLGNKIMENVSASNQMKFDISSLSKGIYFLRVMNGNEIVGTEKFIKN